MRFSSVERSECDMGIKIHSLPAASSILIHGYGRLFSWQNERMDLRERIKELLAEKGVGETKASVDAGLSRRTLGKFLSGDIKNMGIGNLTKVANYLGVTVDYLQHGGSRDLTDDDRKVISIFSRMPRDQKNIVIRFMEAMEQDAG